MKNVIWFSRHEPTAAQLQELEDYGYRIAALEEGQALGAVSLTTDEEVRETAEKLFTLCEIHSAHACLGVFSPPMQEYLERGTAHLGNYGEDAGPSILCLNAWNLTRSALDGGRTFVHKRFTMAGSLVPDLPEYENPFYR